MTTVDPTPADQPVPTSPAPTEVPPTTPAPAPVAAPVVEEKEYVEKTITIQGMRMDEGFDVDGENGNPGDYIVKIGEKDYIFSGEDFDSL